MNPFRIIILSLLSLSLLLMLYVVAILVPERQTEYAQYQSTVQMARFNERSEAHEVRMNQMTAPTATSDVSTALDEVKTAEAKREAALAEAEERSIVALAQAKEEQAAAEAKAAEAEKQQANKGFEELGQVTSFDAEWASIIIKPAEGAIITEGLRVAIMQQQGIVCEAMIDGKDEPSGQYIASMLPGKIGNSDPKPPVLGDKVIVSPFESSKDIRKGVESVPATPTSTQQNLPEIDATLVPIL